VIAIEGLELGLAPFAFLATTVNVYDLPLVSSQMVHVVVAGTVTHAPLAGCDVTMYLVNALTPMDVGRDQLTLAKPLPAIAWTDRGAEGRLLCAPFATMSAMTTMAATEIKPITVARFRLL
jgi:hypothetical protein